MISKKRRGSLANRPRRSGMDRSDPLDHDLAVQIQWVRRSNLSRASWIGRPWEVGRAGGGAGGCSASLGPGFGCGGSALNAYSTCGVIVVRGGLERGARRQWRLRAARLTGVRRADRPGVCCVRKRVGESPRSKGKPERGVRGTGLACRMLATVRPWRGRRRSTGDRRPST